MTRYNHGGSRHRDYDHDFRHRDFDRGFGGFGEFGVPLLGGLAGSLLGNALFPGYGYNGYPAYQYPSYGYPPYGYQPYGYYGPY